MDPAVVGSSQFGIIWRKTLLGNYNGWTEQIYAQALVYTPDDGGKQFVYVASQMNWIYKIDAITGDIVLARNLHIPFLVSELDGCNDISFCIGSTATGVIDPNTGTWYLTTKTYRDQSGVEKGRLNGRYYVHAIDTRTLEEKPNFPINLEGLIANNNPIRMFQGGIHHQRPALMQHGPYIYAGFASHCVQYNFTGWIIGWHGVTGQIVEKFATEGGPEDKKGGGVWMSGGGLASDVPGRLIFATGNGYASQLDTIPVPGRQPPTALEEAVVHMSIQDNGSLKVVDFFMPWEKTALDGADKDLGTSGVALLDPTVFTTPTVKRIGCIAGKSGKLYFLNLDDLGGYQMGPNKKDAVLQVVELKNSVFATAGSYPGTPEEGAYVYVNVVQHESVVFKFSVGPNGEPVFTQVAETPEKTAYVLGVGHGTSTSLNKQPGTGLYWITDIQGLNLRVYKAVPVGSQLELIKGLNIPGQIKFSRPTFGDGRVYLTTSTGHLVMVGSPVNPPLLCTSPVQFGEVTIGDPAGIELDVSCKANIATSITSVALRIGKDFAISNVGTLPHALSAGQNMTFKAKFLPTGPGPLSDDVQIQTQNGVANYAENTLIALRGIGRSLTPILFISPNTVSFPGTITGENPAGVNRSFVIYNQGDNVLTITDYDLSEVSESGPWLPEGSLKAGPITFGAIPTSIPGRGSVTINVNFNPTVNGNYGAYMLIKSNGGNKFVTIVGTSGGYPKAKLEFEKPDGSGWVLFDKGDPNFVFDFGTVYQQTTRTLRLRLTNDAPPGSAILGITVSKPPIGTGQVVGARNGFDLGEGTQLLPGENATAALFCSVPKSQINVDSYIANATWTMNLGDPTFGKHDLKFVCNAAAEQGGPLYPNGQGRYRYLGCFKENNPGRQLEMQLYGSDTNTNNKCIQDCFAHAKNYIYAGTQYHRECWCGNKLPTLKVGEQDCNFDCTGNGTQICGGNGYLGGGSYISLFGDSERIGNGTGNASGTVTLSSTTSTAPTGGPTINPGNAAFAYAGCYAEPPTGRALSTLWGDDGMTVNKCFERCPAFNYVGLEYGRECWCGNILNSGAALKPDAECNMLCQGNAGEYCGAGGRLNLYTKKTETLTTTTSTSSSAVVVETSSLSVGTGETSGITTTISTTASATISTTASTTVSATPTGPVVIASALGYTHIGCYTEATNGRALPDKFLASDTMTVPKCVGFCSDSGYNYAGVEYSTECWCGNALAEGAVLASDQAQCNMLCAGDKLSYCGGSVRLNVYRKAGTADSKVGSSVVSSTPTTSISTSDAPPPPTSTTLELSTSNPPPPPTSTTPELSTSNPPPPPTSTTELSTTAKLSITTTSSSLSPTPTPSPWEYLGCAQETTPRLLGGATTTSPNMTLSLCHNFCLSKNLPLAGLEYAKECYCGLALPPNYPLNATGCSSPCAGNPSQICGGSSRLSIYNNTLYIPPSTPKVVLGGQWLWEGCFTEVAGRAVAGYGFSNSTSMTVEMCVKGCGERGWTVAGLEYARECWCGNEVKKESVLVVEKECNMLCTGNVTEFCGGRSRVGVYMKNNTMTPL
ncbi:WSC domain-containing protein [Kalaharituber pfeilii]|nr:WSC domain-containing protein [Kalaharituber pfeilii]